MSPSATELSSLDRHLSNAEETQLAEALELRRRQIDREIAEFRAEKDKEFRKFEKRLRSEKRDTERLKILQCEREVDKANQKRRGSRDQLVIYSPEELSSTVNGEDKKDATRSNGVRFSSVIEIPPEEDTRREKKGRKKAKSGGSSQDPQSSHEREVEFQGLFTPTFLPLLSGQHQDQTGDILESTPAIPDELSPTDKQPLLSPPAQSVLQDPISGSAPSTPADPRHLSSSDPRKMSMAERRSSSRSDTSVSSLRSSLRDRKQPRSPKRVLFSIDNTVVSPSTSPTVQRKSNAARTNGNSDRSLVIPSYSDLPKDEAAQAYPSSGHRQDISTLGGKAALTNVPTTNGHAGGGVRPMHPAAQIANSSPSMGADGFEHIRGEDDDDLFAFDEDVTYRDKSKGDDDIGDEFKEDELDNGSEVLPTSSPHAGSLPIEIRWPGRKDPR
ncbi:MAG: hypothetical protein Q9209_000240 [Squamulea sp. 1 TL-2023]